jgi:serine/threonine protein kinase
VIYRCLSGCTPFVSDSAVEIMKSHVGEPPLPLSEHPCSAHCDPRLQCIIDKALAKEANERYQSASEIVHDLEAFRSGKHDVLIANDRPSTSTKLPLMANPKKKPGKRWVLVPLAVLALLACSGAAIMWHGQATLLDDGDTGVDDRQRTSLTYVTRANDQFNVELRSRHTEERKQVYNCYRTALKRNKDDHLLSGYQVALAEVRMALFDNADEKYDKGLKEARHALENCDQFGVTSGVYELCICETANALIGLNRVDEAVDLLRERARRWA